MISCCDATPAGEGAGIIDAVLSPASVGGGRQPQQQQ